MIGTLVTLGPHLISMSSGSILKMVTNTSTSLITHISHLSKDDHESLDNFQKQIRKIDLEHKIKLVHALFTDLNRKDIHSHTIKEAVLGLHDILEKIFDELHLVKDKIDNHRTLWFRSLRTVDYKDNLHKIEESKLILDGRYKDLVNLLKTRLY